MLALIKTFVAGGVLLLLDYVIECKATSLDQAEASSFRIQSQILHFRDPQQDQRGDQRQNQRSEQNELALSPVSTGDFPSGLSPNHHKQTLMRQTAPSPSIHSPSAPSPAIASSAASPIDSSVLPPSAPLLAAPSQSVSLQTIGSLSSVEGGNSKNQPNSSSISSLSYSPEESNSWKNSKNPRTVIVSDEATGLLRDGQKLSQKMTRMARDDQQGDAISAPSLPSHPMDPEAAFPHKNHTLDLLHRLLDKFNNFTETRTKLLKRNQSQLMKSLNDFLNNRHQNFQLKLNQTKLRKMLELEKRTNRTSKISGAARLANTQRLLDELMADDDEPDQPEPDPRPPRPDQPGPHRVNQKIVNRFGTNRKGQTKTRMKKYSVSSPNSTMILKVTSKEKVIKKPNKLNRMTLSKPNKNKMNKTSSRLISPYGKMSKMLFSLPTNSSKNNGSHSSDQPTNPMNPNNPQSKGQINVQANHQANHQANPQTNGQANHQANHQVNPQSNHDSPSNSTDPQIDCTKCPSCEGCRQTASTGHTGSVEFKSTTGPPGHSPGSWKQVLGQRFLVKKTSGHAEHTSAINSTVDLDFLIRPNHNSSSPGAHRNLNLKSILKKSKLLAPRYSAKQQMPNDPRMNNTMPQTNYLAQDALSQLPACTILDVFCWCYRFTRFMFIVRY